MDTLLDLVKARLEDQMPDVNVDIVREEFDLPREVKLPFVGITDGKTTIARGPHETEESTLRVSVVVWSDLMRTPEAAIMGDGGKPGVLALAESVSNALDNAGEWTSAAYHLGWCEEMDASKWLGITDLGSDVQAKHLVVSFDKFE